MPVTMLRSATVLQVEDVLASRDFYTGKLGFETAGVWGEPPSFCIVGNGAVTLFLDQSREKGPSPVNQYWAAYVYVEDVETSLAFHRAAGLEPVRGPEDMFYGCRDYDIRDPDGHLICFGEDLQPGPDGPGL